ncbi:MAG: hypothetical protein J2P19_29415, partial [Pseudonocardia sp.]|nr:hypothetical protein [Pseudonocardia sp.]
LPPAPRDVQGVVMPPGLVRPGVSADVAALALGALGAGAAHDRVHTAAGVHKVVAELMESEKEVALLPPLDDGSPDRPDEVWRVSLPPPAVDPTRRRKLTLVLGGLGVGLLVVLGYLGVQVGSLLGVTPPSPPRIVIASPTTAAPAPRPVQAPAQAAPSQAPPLPPDPGRETLVHPASVRVFDPTGDPDNAGRISRLVDDDPKSSWSTYIYKRPFPALKPGVGVMVSFASPVQLSQLSVVSPSTGSRMEVRSAPTPDAPFAQTIPIGELTVNGTDNSVSLTGSQPVQNVLVWITKLGGGGDQNVTEIEDLRFERVTG